MPPGILKTEWSRGKRCWDHRSSRHGPQSWAREPRNGAPPIKGRECYEKRESSVLESRRLHTRGVKRKKVERETGFVIPRFVIASGLIVDGGVTGAK